MIRHLFRPLSVWLEYRYPTSAKYRNYIRRLAYLNRPYDRTLAPLVRKIYKTKDPNYKPKIGMMTIFIDREVILFLDEWIQYHKGLGVEYFYLYDNSKVETLNFGRKKENVELGKSSKRNVQYHRFLRITDEEVREELDRIQRTIPGVYIEEWSPLNIDGLVYYGQNLAQNQALTKHKEQVDWLIFMDVDEYLDSSVSLSRLCTSMVQEGYGGARFSERPMEHYSFHLDRSIPSIIWECPNHEHIDNKIMCYLPRTLSLPTGHDFDTLTEKVNIHPSYVNYRHYRCHSISGDVELVATVPLDVDNKANQTRDPAEWKLSHVSGDWIEIMYETRIDNDMCGTLVEQ